MQSHNHMKRFEGLVLPDCLEALYLVRQSDPMQLRMRCVLPRSRLALSAFVPACRTTIASL
jgi:hypothetical protein